MTTTHRQKFESDLLAIRKSLIEDVFKLHMDESGEIEETKNSPNKVYEGTSPYLNQTVSGKWDYINRDLLPYSHILIDNYEERVNTHMRNFMEAVLEYRKICNPETKQELFIGDTSRGYESGFLTPSTLKHYPFGITLPFNFNLITPWTRSCAEEIKEDDIVLEGSRAPTFRGLYGLYLRIISDDNFSNPNEFNYDSGSKKDDKVLIYTNLERILMAPSTYELTMLSEILDAFEGLNDKRIINRIY